MRWVALLCVMLCAGAVAPVSTVQPEATDTRQTLSREDYERARGLVEKIRFSHPTSESAVAAVEELLSLGEYGPSQVAMLSGRDARSRYDRYLKDFEKAAGRLIRAQVPRDVEQQVIAKREEIRAVSTAENLTKELITSKADPALQALQGWLTVSREAVLAADEKLAMDRQTVLAQVNNWKRAMERLSPEQQKRMPVVEDADRFEEALREKEELMAMMATPMSSADRRVMLANFKIAESMDAEEVVGIHKLNFMRIWIGLPALAIDPKLCDAARDHSKDMKEHNFFAHESPIPGKTTPWDRARNFGTTASGENIFAGSPSGEAAIRAWWHSPGHHKNMMGNHRRVGLGRHDRHWTQLFGG